MLSKHEEQEERRKTLDNDRRVLEGTTFHQFGSSGADTPKGRFTAHDSAAVVGSAPLPKYEGAPNWAPDPTGIEPPTNIDINAMEPCGQPFEVKASVASLEQSPAQDNSGDPTDDLAPRAVGSPIFRSKTFRRA
jgi:hypothetical protein